MIACHVTAINYSCVVNLSFTLLILFRSTYYDYIRCAKIKHDSNNNFTIKKLIGAINITSIIGLEFLIIRKIINESDGMKRK